VSEDGVYTIVVENGDIVRTDKDGNILMTNKTSGKALTSTPITAGDYNQLIKQIAEDYGIEYNEAVEIFENSGIYTSILNAIESSTSSFNKSGGTDCDGTDASWAKQLGNGTNWYDEKTYTFVIRRYKSEGNIFKDLVATDKIDYGLAGNASGSNNQNANAGSYKTAYWTMNLFFKSTDEVKNTINSNLLSGNITSKNIDAANGSSYYDPSGTISIDANSLISANSSGTLILNQLRVTGADFYISSDTTSDFGF
jgi:hypothetical protein